MGVARSCGRSLLDAIDSVGGAEVGEQSKNGAELGEKPSLKTRRGFYRLDGREPRAEAMRP